MTDEWNDSLAGDFLWSNVNFGEAVTDVMTPLTWSVLQCTLEDWTYLPGRSSVGIIGGRPYLNISVFATLFYGMGRSRDDLLKYMESTLYMRLPDEMPIPGIAVSRRTFFRALACSARVLWKQRQGVRQSQTYVDGNRAWFNEVRAAIGAQTTGAGLSNVWLRGIEPHIKGGAWCVLGTATYSADYAAKLRSALSVCLGLEDADALSTNVGEGDGQLESLGPVVGLEKLAQGKLCLSEYLEEFGHRGPQEFELSAPRPAENPAWLEGELEQYRLSPVSAQDRLVQQRDAHARAWQRLMIQSPRAAGRLRAKMVESARRTRLRERARSAYVRDRWACRLWAVRAGELTGLRDRVFFLSLKELLALLAGDSSVTEVIEPRVEAYWRFKALPPYPPIIRGRFDPFAWGADPNRPTDIFDSQRTGPRVGATHILSGAPGSAGVTEGIVRVLNDPNQGGTLKPGEILVAVQTDIVWTLLFPRVAAVITDVGASLSHAAIVARELGIPAVVGCGNATAVLKTGDRVRVDGARGTVEVLPQGL